MRLKYKSIYAFFCVFCGVVILFFPRGFMSCIFMLCCYVFFFLKGEAVLLILTTQIFHIQMFCLLSCCYLTDIQYTHTHTHTYTHTHTHTAYMCTHRHICCLISLQAKVNGYEIMSLMLMLFFLFTVCSYCFIIPKIVL